MRRGPTDSLSPRERVRGEGCLVRDVPTLSFQLVPSCHSDLVPLVIPAWSLLSFPTFLIGNPRARVRGIRRNCLRLPEGVGEARTSCEASTAGWKEKDSGFPLKTCGNDRKGGGNDRMGRRA